MEKDQQQPDHLPDMPSRTEDRLRHEKKQAKKLLESQDECQNLIGEPQVREIELERENKDLKKALSEMAKMELYTALFDFAPVGYFFLERSGTILQVNRSGARLLGVERIELISRNFQSFVSDDFRSAFHDCLNTVLESGVKESCELMLRKEGAQPFHAHIEGKATEDGQGCFFRVVDITDIKKMEEQLKQSESLLKEAQHLARVGHWVIDPATGTSIWSEEVFRIFGLDPEQEAPSFAARREFLHPDDMDHFNNAISKAMSDGASFDIVYRLVRPDKSIRWVNLKGHADRNDGGQVVRLFGTVQDITERKVLEMELAVHHQELEKLVKARTAELEEVNTTLKVLVRHREADKKGLQEKILSNVNDLIIPYLEKIKIGPLNATQEAYMDIVETNIKAIIDPFLSQMTAKHYHLTPQEIQVAALIKSGRSSKEIASILNTSNKTIHFHRGNIRKKLGLANKKVNLRSKLLFMS